jgi:transcriptional regulator with XRE-family HTH domain
VRVVAADGLTGGASEVVGRVAGAVLAAIRSQAGRTQEQLAELLGVGLTTVQAWESGRRPLIHSRFTDLQRVRRQLHLAGTAADMLQLLDQALAVDAIYADMHATDPERHPLGLVVPDRTTTELLAWPLTGELPRQLRGSPARLDVPRGVRDAVMADLRAVVDRTRTDSVSAAMVRRQVKFLVAGSQTSVDWLQQQAVADTRAVPDLRTWSPRWPVARSQAVAVAAAGDLEPLRRFIDQGLSHDDGIAANLNYWAYWVGEHTHPWGSDADMTAAGDWSGERLLGSLLDGVVAAPYRDLCTHSLWALLRQRSHLARNPRLRPRITRAAERALSGPGLGEHSRRRLEQVSYLAESAG